MKKSDQDKLQDQWRVVGDADGRNIIGNPCNDGIDCRHLLYLAREKIFDVTHVSARGTSYTITIPRKISEGLKLEDGGHPEIHRRQRRKDLEAGMRVISSSSG